MPNGRHSRDWRGELTGQIRAIESAHSIHVGLIDWGRWNRGWNGAPRLARPTIWLSMIREYDDDADDSPPVPRGTLIDEKLAVELHDSICARNFNHLWRKVLCANYIHRGPEYQRPKDAHVGVSDYLAALGDSLAALDKRQRALTIPIRDGIGFAKF